MILLAAGLLASQIGGPKTISLNDGWKFARLSNPPSVWTGMDAVPTSQWKVLRVSSQETQGENAPASKAFDGDPKTIWHTQWQGNQAPYPHELVIDMGSKVEASGFRLLSRQSGTQNGKPNHIQVFLSNDPASWGSPVVVDAVPNTSNLFQRPFPSTMGRFLRLVVTDGHRGSEPFLALAEIGLIRNLSQKQKQDWESQYHIATVEAGDERFDLRGSALDKVKASEIAKLKPADWQDATLPHAAWIRPLGKSEIWQGVTYYRRTFTIAPNDLNQFIELSIGGAMQVSDLWLNGEHIASRRGGYLPLVANLTGKAKAKNEVVIRVDNSDNPLVPPGKPQQDLDFMYGAGIHREAKLTFESKVHFVHDVSGDFFHAGSYVLTEKASIEKAELTAIHSIRNDSGTAKSLVLQISIDGAGPIETDVRIPPHDTAVVKTPITVLKPRLWSPDFPHLYGIQSRLVENLNDTVDIVAKKFGIRTIEVSRDRGFVLNGKPLELVGTNRHQDYPWVGPALSRQANYRDARLIKDSGHNIVRLSHYPQSEEFLDACDELGIFVIPCIAGWQFLNKDARFSAQVEQDIRELIQRDGQHTCVAFFEPSLNETYPPNELAKAWYFAAHSTVLQDHVLLAGDAKTGAPWDIAYNQWKDEDMTRPQDVMPAKPGYVREYGDYEFGGTTSTSRVRIGQGLEKLLQETWNHVWSLNHLKPQLPWTMGFGTWEMFDHNVPWELSVSASGLADLFRREKPSYWFYKSQTSKAPYVKLSADWQPGPASRNVVVFTNCDEAILKVNGKEVARAKAQRGLTTKYSMAMSFDGTNTEHLAHPPIVFRDVPFHAGRLQVTGVQRGVSVADQITTAGRAERIKVWVDDLGYRPGTNDLVFVRAAVVDANGTICPRDSRRLHFSVEGAMLAGESDISCEMGVASVLVRTPIRQGKIEVLAKASGLSPGKTRFSF